LSRHDEFREYTGVVVTRSSSRASRAARLLVYGACSAAVIDRNSPAILDSARALFSKGVYLPSLPCIPCALGLACVLIAYLTWLLGATFGRWPMPLWTHLVPIVALASLVLGGPLRPSAVPSEVDMTRAPDLTVFAALSRVRDAVEKEGIRCDDGDRLARVLEDRSQIRLPGYRRFGRLTPYRVRVVRSVKGPVDAPAPDDIPPTIVAACESGGRFWFTAIALSGETGAAETLHDGTGKLVVMTNAPP
jgi:hypothetical protein